MSTSLTAVPETRDDSKSLRDYWMSKITLEDDPASITLDRPLSQDPIVRDGVFELEMPVFVSRAVDNLSGGSSFLAYAVFLAACKACLFRYTRKPSIVTGSPMRRKSSV